MTRTQISIGKMESLNGDHNLSKSRVTGVWPLDMAKAKARQALTTIMEEKDKEERLSRTLNPLPETGLAILIATITDDPEDYLWINAKSTNATTIQAEIN